MLVDELELPAPLREVFDLAAGQIGELRALIVLKGVIAGYASLTYIDGIVRPETAVALRVALMKVDVHNLANEYRLRLRERHGVVPVLDGIPVTEDPPAAPKPRRTRRKR